MIYDMKIDFLRKAGLVAGGNLNDEVPTYMSYSPIIERDGERIRFMITVMN